MTTERQSSWFENFMASDYGRVARGVLGAALVALGLGVIGGMAGWLVAVLGVVPVAAAVLNLCPVAPLWGGHFLGSSYCARRVPRR